MLRASLTALAFAALALVTARAQTPPSPPQPADSSFLMKGATYWHWGTGTFPFLSSEWTPASWALGVSDAQVTTTRPHSGAGSLELTVDLVAGDPNKFNGAVQVWLGGGSNPPCSPAHPFDCPQPPLDLDGITVTAYVFAPSGSRGAGSIPTRLLLGVHSTGADTAFCNGALQNIVDTPAPGSWNLVTLKVGSGPDSCLGNRGAGFDPKTVNNLYVQVVRGNVGSYSGKLWLDDVTLSAPWSRPYDFEITGNSLDRLRQTGANYVSLVQPWFVDTGTSCLIQPRMPDATHTDSEIVTTARRGPIREIFRQPGRRHTLNAD